MAIEMSACSTDQIVGSRQLPAGTADPTAINSARGAAEAYAGTVMSFDSSFADVVVRSGLFTDELSPSQGDGYGSVAGLPKFPLDLRSMTEGVADEYPDRVYTDLSRTRGQAELAAGVLAMYAPDSSAMRAEVYDLDAYSDLFLNEMFCSGVPLSTVNASGGFTYSPGVPTADVYKHAIALFDSARAIAGNADVPLNLARVGEARAYLGLGDYAEAGRLAAQVPDGFAYAATYAGATTFTNDLWRSNVGDHEGGNGMPFRSANDPRVQVAYSSGQGGYLPLKYASRGKTPIIVANWIEARLDQAEAALQASPSDTASQGNGWLGILNHLRESAISPAMADTTDPGSVDGRIDLLFHERAFWLFLQGTRQADLRRLVRVYGRDQSQVYPVGPYDAGAGTFGSDVNAPIPPAEEQYNPLFHGCLDRKA
ncbi:MAG: RagB/SusD family nutrient uptake outer membrane protein [Gemmatimonadaceae bacterium]